MEGQNIHIKGDNIFIMLAQTFPNLDQTIKQTKLNIQSEEVHRKYLWED